MNFNLLVKWRIKHFIATFLLLLSFGFVQAQSLTINGTITDSDGIPLPGVSIVVKGTTNGTTTDFDGLYEILAKKGDVLEISSMGLETKTITVGSETKINLSMEAGVDALEEVVVVGYGSQKKVVTTGATNKVEAEMITKTATSDLGTALQGQVAGVNVQASSGRPGEAANIQIRGLGSLSSGNSEPLYVVDGIPYEGNPNIAPEQIESLDILKDGASSAIYGVRASNGVILITTKRGKEGRMNVELSTYSGIQNITSGSSLMGTKDQLYADKLKANAAGNQPSVVFFNPTALTTETDFVGDVVQRNNASLNNYNLNISGGVKNLTVSANINYFEQEGIIVNSGFDRLSTRLTAEFKKGKFSAFGTMSFQEQNTTQESWGIYEYAVQQMPWVNPPAPYDPSGVNVIPNTGDPTSFSYLAQRLAETDARVTNTSNVAFTFSYEFAKGLRYQLRLGKNLQNYKRDYFRPQFIVITTDGKWQPGGSQFQARLENEFTFSNAETLENVLTYNKTIAEKHNLGFTGVLSYQQNRWERVTIGGAFSEATGNLLKTIGNIVDVNAPTSFVTETALTGLLGRVTYDYDNKYLFSASVRRDGSSKFNSQNFYENFPAVSIGWNISQERFFSENVNFVNSLKLRASWAQVGNNNINNYTGQPIIETGSNYIFGAGNGSLSNGLTQRRFVDEDVIWETTISRNFGIDASFFANRLQFTADIYNNGQQDMLLEQQNPPSSGTSPSVAVPTYSVTTINAGEMENKGVELALTWRDKTEFGLGYNVNAVFTQNKNEVTNLNGVDRGYANGRPIQTLQQQTDYTTYLAEGYEAGAFFLVQHAGVIKTDQQLQDYQLIQPSAQLGDMMYKDQNGDNVIDDNDRVYSGSGQAKFEAGLNLGLDYKGFDFFVQTFYSNGAKLYNGSRLWAYATGRSSELVNQWSPQNPTADVPAYRTSKTHENYRARSDYFLEDGTYFRIRSLSIGYSLSKELIADMGMNRLRVYATATNPFTFTEYTGYDPEVGGDGLFTRGIDTGSYPVARQFSIGVQLGF